MRRETRIPAAVGFEMYVVGKEEIFISFRLRMNGQEAFPNFIIGKEKSKALQTALGTCISTIEVYEAKKKEQEECRHGVKNCVICKRYRTNG